MRLAIADPPYPPHRGGRPRGSRWYGDSPLGGPHNHRADNHPDAREWDDPARHRTLLTELHNAYDGWAIATALDSIDAYMPLPEAARILIWHKLRPLPTSARVGSSLEAVIVRTPPTRRGIGPLGQVPQLHTAAAPNGGFAGAKPPSWTRWVLDAMGYDPDTDTVTDLFPGSGAVTNEIRQGVIW